MKTWAYRLAFDLAIASKQELYEANQVVGTAALYAKSICVLAFMCAAWLHPGYHWQWGQWVIASAVIDLMYRKRVNRISISDQVHLTLRWEHAIGFGLFWGLIIAGGAGLVTGQWGMTLGFGLVLAGLVGLVSDAHHRELKPKDFTESFVTYRRWRQIVYRTSLGLAVLDEAEVEQVEDRFGLALVGLQLFGYWCLVVPGVLQVNTHDWWIGLIAGTAVILAVSHQVSKSGLDQEIYPDPAAFYKRRRHLFIWQIVQMGLFAGGLGSLAWFHGRDPLLTVMNIAIGLGLGRSLYTTRRAKVFLGAKRPKI